MQVFERFSDPRWLRPATLVAGALMLAPLSGDVERDRPEARPKSPAPDVERKDHDEADADEHAKLHERLADESKANLARIGELMEKIQQELAERRTGESTQHRQSEVVKKIDELIDELAKG